MSDDFRLKDLMTVNQAVEQYRFFSRRELFAAMRAGDLRHWRRGRERFVTERWLKDWIRSQLRGCDPEARKEDDRPDPANPGIRPEVPVRRMRPDEQEIAAGLLARSIMGKPWKDPCDRRRRPAQI